MNQTQKIINQAKKEGRKALLETEAKTICAEYGIPVTKFNIAKNEKEAITQADQIGYPIVLKIVSPDIIHKSDAGGVIVNLKTAADVAAGYKKIIENATKYKADAKIVGVLVSEMAPQSTEVIVGAVKDPQFGQTVMFGLGGIFVELLKDVNFRVAPLTADDAKEMIMQLKGLSAPQRIQKHNASRHRSPRRHTVQYITSNHGLPRNQGTRPKPNHGLLERCKNSRCTNNTRIRYHFLHFLS